MSDQAQTARLELLVLGREGQVLDNLIKSLASRGETDSLCVVAATLQDLVDQALAHVADLEGPADML